MPTFWAELRGNGNRFKTRLQLNKKLKYHPSQQSQTHTERLTLFWTPHTSCCRLSLMCIGMTGLKQSFTLKKNPLFGTLLCLSLKPSVQRIGRGVETRQKTIGNEKLSGLHVFFLFFKGTPSCNEHKTVFSGLTTYSLMLIG